MAGPTPQSDAPLRVEFLGSGGYHPSERRHTACLLVPHLGLLLDAGTGAFRVRGRADALPDDRLDVVLTHAHLDHVVGLTYLLGLSGRRGPVETVVHATESVLAAVEGHLLATALFPLLPVARFEALGETLPLSGGATLRTFPVDHPGGAIGVRIDAPGRSFAYMTDTRPLEGEALAPARGIDLLLHEACFDDSRRQLAIDSGHSTAREAARVAADLGVGRLILLHLDPRATEADEARGLAEARSVRADAEYAIDGMVATV